MTNNKIFVSLLLTAAAAAQAPTTTSAPRAGETLSNGGYVCNPAHSYPGATCDGLGNPPTLSYYPTTSAPKAGETLSNGGYVCNPAHSYPGATCDGKGNPPTLSYYPTTSAPKAGETLGNGAYVCNPAHSYPGATCTGSPPTLSYYPTTSAPQAGQTLSNGAYVCNPAHSYPGATCTGSPPTLSYYPTSSGQAPAATTLVTKTVTVCAPEKTTFSAPPAQPTAPSGKQCPVTLAGTQFEYPHLLVTSENGQQTSNTLYFGTVSASKTSYFNFDIPASYAGKTCEVVFALPRQDQLETSSFQLTGNGQLTFNSLKQAAAEHAAVPAVSAKLGSWTLVAGNAFTVAKGACAAGQRIGYSVAADGDRYLNYFQDYNPCPIGLYIIVR